MIRINGTFGNHLNTAVIIAAIVSLVLGSVTHAKADKAAAAAKDTCFRRVCLSRRRRQTQLAS